MIDVALKTVQLFVPSRFPLLSILSDGLLSPPVASIVVHCRVGHLRRQKIIISITKWINFFMMWARQNDGGERRERKKERNLRSAQHKQYLIINRRK